jgi:hypothetical protein
MFFRCIYCLKLFTVNVLRRYFFEKDLDTTQVNLLKFIQ